MRNGRSATVGSAVPPKSHPLIAVVKGPCVTGIVAENLCFTLIAQMFDFFIADRVFITFKQEKAAMCFAPQIPVRFK